jgi:hypothetical protein
VFIIERNKPVRTFVMGGDYRKDRCLREQVLDEPIYNFILYDGLASLYNFAALLNDSLRRPTIHEDDKTSRRPVRYEIYR